MRHDTQATTAPSTGRRQALARISHRAGLLPPLARARAVLRDDQRILAYHRVLETVPPAFSFDLELVSAWAERFREQMALIRRRFHPMRFDEVLACRDAGRRLPRNAVLVTFDDGYDDNYRVAYPILHDLGLSAMFFVATGHIAHGALLEGGELFDGVFGLERAGPVRVFEAGQQAARRVRLGVTRALAGRVLRVPAIDVHGHAGIDAAVQAFDQVDEPGHGRHSPMQPASIAWPGQGRKGTMRCFLGAVLLALPVPVLAAPPAPLCPGTAGFAQAVQAARRSQP